MQRHLGQRQTCFCSGRLGLTPFKLWRSTVLEDRSIAWDRLYWVSNTQSRESKVMAVWWLWTLLSLKRTESVLRRWGNVHNKMRQSKRENVQTLKLLLETSTDHSCILPIRAERKCSRESQSLKSASKFLSILDGIRLDPERYCVMSNFPWYNCKGEAYEWKLSLECQPHGFVLSCCSLMTFFFPNSLQRQVDEK